MELCLFVAYCLGLAFLYFLSRHYLEKFQIGNLSNRAVFISGCDTGFGRDLALKCTRAGMPVFAGCLTSQGATNLQKSAEGLHGKLRTILLDVTSDESVEKARILLEKETEKYGGLHGIVNNAGVASSTFFDDFLSLNDYKKVSEVNLWGVLRTTKSLKPLVKKCRGRIVFVASICARVGLPGMGPYTVSKFAVSGYCDVLRQELRQWGVSVHVLEPGFFKTPLIAKENLQKSLKDVWERCPQEVKEEYGSEYFEKSVKSTDDFMQGIGSENIEWVVNSYFHALTARFPRTRYQIGWDCHFLWIPLSLIPSRIQDLIIMLSNAIIPLPVPAKLRK